MADPNAMIPVVDPETGKTGYIDPKFAPEAARTGLRGATDAQLRGAQVQANTDATRADLNKDYEGTFEGTVAPFAAGAARGASLGLSDVALGKLGGEGVRRRLLDYQDYAPGASMVGEIAGVAGSALLGNEAGLVGAVGKLGAGAERAAVGALGRGLVGKGAGYAARGAVEGALYAEGKAAGDAALHNEALTTEKAVAAMGHGALFGAGANVLLGGAGAGLGRLLRREEGAIAGLATKGEALAEREATGAGNFLQKQADIKTIKAFSGSAADFRGMENSVEGGFRKVAQDIRGDLEAATGKSIGFHNKESLHAYAEARVEELGTKLGGMLKKLDESGSGIAPDIKGFAAKVREELVAPHQIALPDGSMVLRPGKAAEVRAAEGWLAQVEGAYGTKPPTFIEWQQARRALDKDINFAARNASPEMDALKQVRGMMEKELEVSGEAAAKNVGAAFADEYKATKSLYQSVRTAEEMSLRGVSREMVNNGVGLRATMGGLAGFATGNPILGVAAGAAGVVVKDRGDMLAADLLHRAANLAGVQRLAASTDAAMAKGVAGLLGTRAIETGAMATTRVRTAPAAPLGVILSGDLHKDFEKLRAETVKLSTSPAQVIDRVTASLGPEASKSPGVAGAAVRLATGDVAFLAGKLPPPRVDQFTLQPQLQPTSRASDAEKSAFLEAARAIANPTIMLDQARAGALTPGTVEAIKERRPELYAQMRGEIFQSLTTSKTELPYGRRVQLGILLDLPTDQTLAPDFVRAVQATYTAQEKAGVEPPPPQLASLDVSSSLMTSTQSAATGGKAR